MSYPCISSSTCLCVCLLQLADEDPKPVTDLAIQASSSRSLHGVCVGGGSVLCEEGMVVVSTL